MNNEVATPVSPRDFHDWIYGGEVLLFHGLPEMQALMSFARALAETTLAPHHPTEAQAHLSKGCQIERYGGYQSRYPQTAEVKALWARLFEAIGLPPDDLARDRRPNLGPWAMPPGCC